MMLKKLIPAAALLALAGAAQAEVTPYGLIDVAFSQNLNSDSEFRSGGNSTTKFGLKGSQDLTAGLKGTFQFEAGVTKDLQKRGAFFERQAWAGVAGGLGEVRVGTQDSVGFQTLVPFDLNGSANVAAAGTGPLGVGLGLLDGIGKRSVQYIAPVVSGFKVQVGYQADNNQAATVAGSKASTAVGVTYTLGKFAAAATAASKNVVGGNGSSAVAASYDFGVAKAMASYSGTKGAKGSMVGVVAPVAGVNVGLQYARNTDTKITATEVFVNKEIMKNTFAYADFLSKKGAASDAYAIGVIYTF